MMQSGCRSRPLSWGTFVRNCCESLLCCAKPVSLLLFNAIITSYLAISYHAAWNKAAIRTVHYEIVLLTGQIDKRLEGMENSIKQMIILMKGIHDLMAAGALSEVATKKIRQEIQQAISLYDADKIGMTDYALATLGGCIRSTRKTESYKDGSPPLTLFGIPIMSMATDPKTIIQARVQPGECWAFKGQSGNVVIELIRKIFVSDITMEHIPASISPSGEISSAPKAFSVLGISALDDCTPHNFGRFTYNVGGPAVQTFRVKHPSNKPFKLIEIVFESNHGNPKFTCVYRVRIHGKLPGPP